MSEKPIIPREHVSVREDVNYERDYTVIVASVRYARAIRVYHETIADHGDNIDVLELARQMAVDMLVDSPRPVLLGETIPRNDFEMPEKKES